MKRYLTYGGWGDVPIQEIEVARETEKCYFIARRGVRGGEDRRIKSEEYHTSWDAARDHLVSRSEADLARHERGVNRARTSLEALRGMTKP